MPGLPDAITDLLTHAALKSARAGLPPADASVGIAAAAQHNETALRLARIRLLACAERAADPEICRRAAGHVAAALAWLGTDRPARPA